MNIVRNDFTNPEDYIMKRTLLTAALASLIIGTSAQAGSLSNEKIYAMFGEETYLDDHSLNRVDMAPMEIRSKHRSSSKQAISLTAIYEIFGEEMVGKSLPRADMASMEICSKRSPSTYRGGNEAYTILNIDV
jgi:hypothetical protein